MTAGIFQFFLLAEALGIEIVPPFLEDPTADADVNAHFSLPMRAKG
jgi:hypothetical protein